MCVGNHGNNRTINRVYWMGGKELEDEEYIWGYGWHADGQMNVGGGGE